MKLLFSVGILIGLSSAVALAEVVTTTEKLSDHLGKYMTLETVMIEDASNGIYKFASKCDSRQTKTTFIDRLSRLGDDEFSVAPQGYCTKLTFNAVGMQPRDSDANTAMISLAIVEGTMPKLKAIAFKKFPAHCVIKKFGMFPSVLSDTRIECSLDAPRKGTVSYVLD